MCREMQKGLQSKEPFPRPRGESHPDPNLDSGQVIELRGRQPLSCELDQNSEEDDALRTRFKEAVNALQEFGFSGASLA